MAAVKNAWQALEEAKLAQISVVLLQEIHMKPEDVRAWSQRAFRYGYRAVTATLSPSSGGVAMLLPLHMQASQEAMVVEEGGQALLMRVGGVTLGSIYLAHDNGRIDFQHSKISLGIFADKLRF